VSQTFFTVDWGFTTLTCVILQARFTCTCTVCIMNPDLHAEYSMFCYPVPLRVKICYLFSYRYFHHYLYLCFDVAQVRRSQKLFPFPRALKRCAMSIIKMAQMLHEWVSCFSPHTHVKPAILLHSISISHSFVPSLPPSLPPSLEDHLPARGIIPVINHAQINRFHVSCPLPTHKTSNCITLYYYYYLYTVEVPVHVAQIAFMSISGANLILPVRR